MPEVMPQTPSFVPPTPPAPDDPAAPGWNEMVNSAWKLESPVSNAWEFFSKPTFPPDPNFSDLVATRERGYWDTPFRDSFIGARSTQEFDWREKQLKERLRQRDVMARSGWAGTAVGLGVGVFDPTNLIPLVGRAPSLVLRVAESAGLGAIAGGLSELPAQMNQPERTFAEGATHVGASLVLGALLGTAAHYLSPIERVALEKRLDTEGGMAIQPGGKTVPEPNGAPETPLPPRADFTTGFPASGGAAASREGSISGIRAGFPSLGKYDPVILLRKWLDSNPVSRNPVTDSLSSFFDNARYGMAQLSNANLSLEGNKFGIPVAPGGTVEDNIKPWEGREAMFHQELDKQFREYYYGTPSAPKILPNLRAKVGAHFSSQKMSRAEFNKQVTLAGWEGNVHDDPFVTAAAKSVHELIYKPMQEVMQKVGLLADELKEMKDPQYLQHLWDTKKIENNPMGFVDFLSAKFEEKLQEKFAKELEKVNRKKEREQSLIANLQRPPEEVAKMQEKINEELRQLDEVRPAPQQYQLDDIAGLRSMATRALQRDPGLQGQLLAKQYRADAREMEKALSPDLLADKARKAELKRVRRELSGSQLIQEEKKRAILNQVDDLEERSENDLYRVMRVGRKLLNEMDTLSDKELDKRLSEFKNQFEKAGRIYDKGEAKIVKAGEENPDVGDLVSLQARQEARHEKLTDLARKVDELDSADRHFLRGQVELAIGEVVARNEGLAARRAVKVAKLRERAGKIDPAGVNARINEIVGKGRDRELQFMNSWGEKGARLGSETSPGQAFNVEGDFTGYARTAAEQVRNKIMGTTARMPQVDIMQGERGSELARTLDVSGKDAQAWLETDIEKLVSAHIRTLAPDVEIFKKFGSVNAGEYLGRGGKLETEYNQKIAAVTGRPVERPKEGPTPKKGEKAAPPPKFEPMKQAIEGLTPAQQKQINFINDELHRDQNNFEAVIGRLRHTWGVPTDPQAMGERMGRVALNWNVLRYMGGVTVSSIPDIARPIMRYGVVHTFREGFIPLITNFKTLKASMMEARWAGAATDVPLNSRFHAMNDIVDQNQRGSAFERGTEYLTGKMGIVALFNQWTDMLKMWSGAMANAKLMDSIARAAQGKASPKMLQYLADQGIGQKQMFAIWDQVQLNGGANKVNGVWLPNTERWGAGAQPGTGAYAAAQDAQQIYRQALAREVNGMILTPGVERPAWVNKNMGFRLVTQFKSFQMTATTKMLMAGMQQRDMAFVNGTVMSLALGGLSYYTYATLAGGNTKKVMEDSIDRGDWRHWADQMVNRSGILGSFGIGQDLLSHIPYAPTIAGKPSTRVAGDSMLQSTLGPGADLFSDVSEIGTQWDDPGKRPFRKAFKNALPYHNLTLFRRLADQIDAPAGMPQQ